MIYCHSISKHTGLEFLERARLGRNKIAKKGLPFIKDGAVRQDTPTGHVSKWRIAAYPDTFAVAGGARAAAGRPQQGQPPVHRLRHRVPPLVQRARHDALTSYMASLPLQDQVRRRAALERHSSDCDRCAFPCLFSYTSDSVQDSAVGYMMERMDLVIVGAEAVVESGGVINTVLLAVNDDCGLHWLQVGTYQMALVSKACNKPFFVGSSMLPSDLQ